MTSKSRVVWYVAYVAVGILMVVLGVLGYVSEVLSGIGGALAGVGTIRLVQEARCTRNPDYSRRREVANTDERNVFLAGKSASTTFRLSILGLAVISIAVRLAGQEAIANTLGFVMCAELVVYWVSYLVLSRRY